MQPSRSSAFHSGEKQICSLHNSTRLLYLALPPSLFIRIYDDSHLTTRKAKLEILRLQGKALAVQ